MSTVPGSESWRDAGLAPADTELPLRLTDVDEAEVPDTSGAEEYTPGFPRADREDRATEADVVEQATEVPLDDEGTDA
ncbi:hypothetical protein H9657_14730 [Cellulomonas sp. Sa3CUA2]|uniref:DUF5709 domain-containing protein n=1 Tax=Cellulomonas avistercoris TaxID=2762242 RepID=A0ABR8QGT3_9CELL|nr:hypothetical protein [Cellulomonas avistercoris]MBD7919524.1 hypothetical protein [Cellulomonas avistercoris]